MAGRLYSPINLPPLVITTASLPGAIIGEAYSTTLAATGGAGGYTWSILSNVPNTGSWLSISAGGVLSGTPTTAETETLLIKVQDSNGTMATAFFTLAVSAGSGGFYPAGHWVQSNLALQIIAPFPGLTTTNRYYKHHPAFAYRVPVIAIGGAYPHVFTLTSAPAGMTIGQIYGSTDYGIINWANPVVGTYTITVSLQDQNQSTPLTVSWTLTVTTAGFVWVDSVNGSPSAANGGTGTGTQANPLKTFDDIYSGVVGHAGTNAARKADATWAGFFVVMRNGTYTTAQVNFEAGNSGQRAPMTSGNKPKVWIGYPGETATFDTTGSYLSYYSENSVGLWFSNITVAGMEATGGYKFVAFQSMSDHGFFELTFSTPTATGIAGTNPDMIFSEANSPNLATRGFIKRCTFNNTLNHSLIEMYCTSTWAMHDNTLAGVNDSVGFYAKGDGSHPTVGGNDTISVRGNIGLQANTGRDLFEVDNYAYTKNVEVCYNVYKSSGAGIYYGPDPGGSGITNVYSFRNSWQVSEHTISGVPVTGPTVINDALSYSASTANAHGYEVINSGSQTSPSYSGEELVAHNGNFFDANLNLIGTGLPFVGIRGAKIA